MRKALQSVRKKMGYVMDHIANGPLNETEFKNLIGHLSGLKNESIWGIAIQQHFTRPEKDRDDVKMVETLAEQAMDDIFTMTCVVGLNAVILILRTVKD